MHIDSWIKTTWKLKTIKFEDSRKSEDNLDSEDNHKSKENLNNNVEKQKLKYIYILTNERKIKMVLILAPPLYEKLTNIYLEKLTNIC